MANPTPTTTPATDVCPRCQLGVVPGDGPVISSGPDAGQRRHHWCFDTATNAAQPEGRR